MKNLVIKNERNYLVFAGNAISVMGKLSAKIYELCLDKEKGYSLGEIDNNFNITQKLYGSVEKISRQVLQSFDTTEGNLGVLISGSKGLGKSLTIKKIGSEALKTGLPVILVKQNLGNITSFIDTIHQPCVIILDEFKKHYTNQTKTEQDEMERQDCLLNMFDSTLAAKKLFLLTCNDTRNLSEYLLNRPGRIHYHFKSNRLTIVEITEYCKDNLLAELHDRIPDICNMGARIPDFSYDMLHAIIFELNTYKSTLEDVGHILNIGGRARSPFDFKIYFKSGKIEAGFDYINISSTRFKLCWYSKQDFSRDYAFVNPSKAQWMGKDNGSLVLTEDINWPTDDDVKTDDLIEKIVFIPAKKGYLADGNYDNDDD
ncbi:hypothetical protein FACS1894172_03230 [Spirochaetia bacterium]|nr:hypothetical protein FACS1894172_03230 [Spirochaetia bacterium]